MAKINDGSQRTISPEAWHNAVAEVTATMRVLGCVGVSAGGNDITVLSARRSDDGVSVAAGVAAEWYGLPTTLRGIKKVTEEDMRAWRAVEPAAGSDWLRAGLGEWVVYLTMGHTEELARMSLVRPDIVALVPVSIWTSRNGWQEMLVSRYIRDGGAVGVVPVEVWPEYLRWVTNEYSGFHWIKREGLAPLSWLHPEVLADIEPALWRSTDEYGEPFISGFLREGGNIAVVPDEILPDYLKWLLSESGEMWQKAQGAAKLSVQRADLVAGLPASCWVRQGQYDGELFVSMYVRDGGDGSIVPEVVWDGYLEWIHGETGYVWVKTDGLARLSAVRPDVVARVDAAFWARVDARGAIVVSRYLNAGGAAEDVPEVVWPEYVLWLRRTREYIPTVSESLARLSHVRPDVVLSLGHELVARFAEEERYRAAGGLALDELIAAVGQPEAGQKQVVRGVAEGAVAKAGGA